MSMGAPGGRGRATCRGAGTGAEEALEFVAGALKRKPREVGATGWTWEVVEVEGDVWAIFRTNEELKASFARRF